MEYRIEEDFYIILLKYFQGDVMNITLEKVKNIKNMKFNDQPIKEVSREVLKELVRVLTMKRKNPKKYANTKWIYPNWSDEEKEKKLKEAFPEEYDRTTEEVEEEDDDDDDRTTEEGITDTVHLIPPKNGKYYTYRICN